MTSETASDTLIVAGGFILSRKPAKFLLENIDTRAEQSRTSSPRLPAVAYCKGTLLRNEIEA